MNVHKTHDGITIHLTNHEATVMLRMLAVQRGTTILASDLYSAIKVEERDRERRSD